MCTQPEAWTQRDIWRHILYALTVAKGRERSSPSHRPLTGCKKQANEPKSSKILAASATVCHDNRKVCSCTQVDWCGLMPLRQKPQFCCICNPASFCHSHVKKPQGQTVVPNLHKQTTVSYHEPYSCQPQHSSARTVVLRYQAASKKKKKKKKKYLPSLDTATTP